MYWVLLCLSSGTDLQKSRHVLKSLSLCNKVLSYLILSLSLFWVALTVPSGMSFSFRTKAFFILLRINFVDLSDASVFPLYPSQSDMSCTVYDIAETGKSDPRFGTNTGNNKNTCSITALENVTASWGWTERPFQTASATQNEMGKKKWRWVKQSTDMHAQRKEKNWR